VDRGTVERVWTAIERDCGLCTFPADVSADSEFSLLSSSALNTLFGLLPLPGGDPTGPIEEGLLFSEPSTNETKASTSSFFVPRPGVGDNI
jgi:hypothetical protein